MTDAPTRAELAARLDELQAQVDTLQDDLATERERRREAETERDHLRERVDELEQDGRRLDSLLGAISNRVDANISRLIELQSRELEKGAHLDWENVDAVRDRLDVDGDRLERFEGDDGEDFARLPGEADPLARSGTSSLATADLLPIQQLARMDDDMLRSAGPLPVRLAARAWSERETLWNQGSGDVRQYLDAGDLKSWIRRREDGVSEDYAKKLTSRTIDALLDLTKNRIYVEKRSHRKDGLSYKERRIVLPTESDIPGETDDRSGDNCRPQTEQSPDAAEA